MKHGRDCPDRCSMCLGATPKRIVQEGPLLVIDGIPERAIEPLSPGQETRAQRRSRRGGEQRALRSAPRSKRR